MGKLLRIYFIAHRSYFIRDIFSWNKCIPQCLRIFFRQSFLDYVIEMVIEVFCYEISLLFAHGLVFMNFFLHYLDRLRKSFPECYVFTFSISFDMSIFQCFVEGEEYFRGHGYFLGVTSQQVTGGYFSSRSLSSIRMNSHISESDLNIGSGVIVIMGYSVGGKGNHFSGFFQNLEFATHSFFRIS